MAEIAPDPPGWLTALRFDIDTEGGGAAWIEAELPAPNLVVVNPRNGHAHLIDLLGGWIRTDFGDPSRLKVVRYAAAIERAYAAALGADKGYSGRFHHDPLSAAYVTKVGRDAPYSLAELAQYVDLAMPATKPAPLGSGETSKSSTACGAGRTPRSPTGRSARTTHGTGRSRAGRVRLRSRSVPRAHAGRSSRTRSAILPRAWPGGSGSATSLACRRCCARRRSPRNASVSATGKRPAKPPESVRA